MEDESNENSTNIHPFKCFRASQEENPNAAPEIDSSHSGDCNTPDNVVPLKRVIRSKKNTTASILGRRTNNHRKINSIIITSLHGKKPNNPTSNTPDKRMTFPVLYEQTTPGIINLKSLKKIFIKPKDAELEPSRDRPPLTIVEPLGGGKACTLPKDINLKDPEFARPNGISKRKKLKFNSYEFLEDSNGTSSVDTTILLKGTPNRQWKSYNKFIKNKKGKDDGMSMIKKYSKPYQRVNRKITSVFIKGNKVFKPKKSHLMDRKENIKQVPVESLLAHKKAFQKIPLGTDPRRILILEKYRKDQNNYIEYLRTMNLFKKGLLKLALDIFNNYIHNKGHHQPKMLLLMSSSKIQKKVKEINNDLEMVKERIEMDDSSNKDSQGQGISLRSSAFNAKSYIINMMSSGSGRKGAIKDASQEKFRMSKFSKHSQIKVGPKGEPKKLFKSYSEFECIKKFEPNQAIDMEAIKRVRRMEAMRKTREKVALQIFNHKKFLKEINKAHPQKRSKTSKGFWNFMPHSKEEEERQQEEKRSQLRKKQYDMGKIVMKVMSHSLKDSQKKDRIGRKGQQVQ
ncbi:unnamed protein product [Moneuplotes crassus]|uniref:Uncharacterized protein n=1 Tax=Euplotes crassus TaxID=5936 RepID=A0AAD1X3P9_EUPCR|nr:unnamed protein product [Moneuplotes crassus]